MTGVINIKEKAVSHLARRHMNSIGLALLALMFLQWVVSMSVYYAFAKHVGAPIGFYGISPAGILKTVAQLKRAAGRNVLVPVIALLLATVIADTVPFVICARAADVDLRQVFSRPKVSGGTTALYGIVAFGASLFASLAVSLVSQLLKSLAKYQLTMPSISIPWKSPAGAVVMILAVVVAAPLAEEFICRGVLLNVFRRFGDFFAVVASSLVWALLHGNFVQGLPVFAMGLFFGMLALKADSIIPTVILHSLNNILSMAEQTAAIRNTVSLKFGVSMINFTLLIIAVVLASVYYRSFEGVQRGESARGFAAFFTCVPIIIAILICAAATALSIKPV